jgi:predicted nucleic acid-binding protein
VTEVFADTFYLLALINPSDAAHEWAVVAAQALRAPLVTTTWVLTELADAMADPGNRDTCVGFIDDLRGQSKFVILPPTQELFEAGFELYRNRPDKGWSLTDCISFHVMQDRNMTDALTGDHHFEQAGFAALLKIKGVRNL